MREENYERFKSLFRNELLLCRKELGLTHAKMAERLEISERAYISLESGKSTCNVATLLQFLVFCCNDPKEFSEKVSVSFKRELVSSVSANSDQ